MVWRDIRDGNPVKETLADGGTRAIAGGRGSGWGQRMSATKYQAAANRSTFVSVQIESMAGVEQVEQIALVEGLDCVFVGLSDLSAELGAPGQWDHQLLVDALDRIHAASATENQPVGYPAADALMAQILLERGAPFVASADTAQLTGAMSKSVAEVSAFVE